MRQCLLKRFSMEAVGAVPVESSVCRQLRQCLLKRFSMMAVGAVPVERFSTQAVEAVPSQKVQHDGSWGSAG